MTYTKIKLIVIIIMLAAAGLGTRAALNARRGNVQTADARATQTVVAANKALASNGPTPVSLAIPSLNINAPFVPLGLKPDNTIEVPKGDFEVGWYVHGSKPGEVGPAVVVGHLDSAKNRRAIFADLKKIKPGDKIFIQRADGSQAAFKVDSVAKFSQTNFPTRAVYGATSYPALRLITCTGAYSKKAGRYSDNLVVFATMI